jgi:hypothetical protein
MSVAMADCGISWNTHDPGVVLTHLAVSIAEGADCLSATSKRGASNPSCLGICRLLEQSLEGRKGNGLDRTAPRRPRAVAADAATLSSFYGSSAPNG